MSLHALDALDDALTATRRYRPRGLVEWVWVVVVAGTVGSPGIGLPTGGGGTGNAGMPPEQRAALEEQLPASIPDLAVYVGVAVVALWLLFIVAGAFFEFPFLRWLRDGEFSLRAEATRHWRQALGLAVFRVVLNVLSLAILGGIVVAFVGTDADPTAYVVALSNYGILFGLVGLVTGLVGAFTTAFVVPAMWLEDRSVVGGWRRVWPTLTGAPKQFLVYAVAVAILATVGGFLVGIAALVGLIPALLVALAVAATVSGTAGVLVGAVLGGVLMTIGVGVVYAVVQVFLRFYALLVLGDIDTDLDAMPTRRRQLRADGGAESDSDGDDGSVDGDATGPPQ